MAGALACENGFPFFFTPIVQEFVGKGLIFARNLCDG